MRLLVYLEAVQWSSSLSSQSVTDTLFYAASAHGEYVLLRVFICFSQVVSAIIIHLEYESDRRSRFYARYLRPSIIRPRFLHFKYLDLLLEMGRTCRKRVIIIIILRITHAPRNFSPIGLSLSYVRRVLSSRHSLPHRPTVNDSTRACAISHDFHFKYLPQLSADDRR